MRIFVTGFGAFGAVTDNPTTHLARRCGCDHAILPVRWSAVDAFLDGFDSEQFDALLLMGVNAKATVLHLERMAQNHAAGADIDEISGAGVIEHGGPQYRVSTLWRRGDRLHPEFMAYSRDAGTYLCNYSLYRALQRHPSVAIGFLHVPPFEAIPQNTQEELLEKLLLRIKVRR